MVELSLHIKHTKKISKFQAFHYFFFIFIFICMVMDWQNYYELNKNNGTINEIVRQYNMYVYETQEQYDAELRRKLGINIMLLQENGYALIQEGEHQYGLLQEIR